eukprot:jgi/Botrbrau1/2146/Bobra.0093s0051.1
MDHALLQHVWHIAGPLFRSLSVRIMRSIYCIHTCILSAQASTRLAHRRTFGSQARALVWGGGGRKSYTPWPPPPNPAFFNYKDQPQTTTPWGFKVLQTHPCASLMLGSGDGVARAYPRGAPDTIHAGS